MLRNVNIIGKENIAFSCIISLPIVSLPLREPRATRFSGESVTTATCCSWENVIFNLLFHSWNLYNHKHVFSLVWWTLNFWRRLTILGFIHSIPTNEKIFFQEITRTWSFITVRVHHLPFCKQLFKTFEPLFTFIQFLFVLFVLLLNALSQKRTDKNDVGLLSRAIVTLRTWLRKKDDRNLLNVRAR